MINLVEELFYPEEQKFEVKDITYCLCIRVSEITPWIISRLEFCLSFYDPKPNILVVDFGSEDEYANEIFDICKKNGAKYIYENDKDEFSLAKARNIAVENVETNFFMLSDIDFVFEKNIFGRLADDATNLKMGLYPKRFITMPICHLEERLSEEFWQTNNKQSKIKEFNYFVSKAEYGKDIEFYTSYSNVFFMSKELFNLAGGYCDKFRGHGSEDFDLMLRLGYICSDIPKSEQLNKDFYGPLKDSYWGQKNYSGFRRYVEAVMFNNTLLGYQAYHMWHPKPKKEGYWTNTNDWKREKFNEVIEPFIKQEEKVLEIDYIEKEKLCLCLMGDYKNWRYFLPFRQLGYKLKVMSRNNLSEIVEGYNLISENKVDLICIFNPYMKSHKKYKDLCDFAKKNNVEVILIERGGLPNTIYYANEVSYNDVDFNDFDNLKIELKNNEFEKTKIYIDNIRKGANTLELMESFEVTIEKPEIKILSYSKSIFIPLQLNDDMAVTFFNDGYISYSEFLEEIEKLIEYSPDIQFVIKKHPLDKSEISFNYSNVKILKDENIHAVIESVSAVLVYNSGVGLLALAHGKPVYSFGNAYYGFNNKFVKKIKEYNDLVVDIESGDFNYPETTDVVKLYFWLIRHKYSTFTATDIIRDFGDRKSHAYDNINVEFANIKGNLVLSGLKPQFNYNKRSYLNSIIKLDKKKNEIVSVKKDDFRLEKEKDIKSGIDFLSIDLIFKKVKKLKNNPKKFFVDFIEKRI